MIVKLKKFFIYLKRIISNEYVLLDENSIKKPLASKSVYLKIFKEASKNKDVIISELEKKLGYSIEKKWLDDLALHTQVCIKKSKINYQHGMLLYSTLRNYLESHRKIDFVNIVETGTARGFSAICMSKALNDTKNVAGVIHTIDILPNNKRMYWNIIDDNENKKTRQELLAKWPQELKNIKFIEGKTNTVLKNLNLTRVNYAFMDAEHNYKSVISEFNYLKNKQIKDDIIFFDDVTRKKFPGVVKALKEIEEQGFYNIEYFTSSSERGYAIAKRK